MGFFDSIGRTINKGIGAFGGFLGDLGSAAVESFSDVGPTQQTGIARTIGGFVGDIGEQLVGGFLAPPAPVPTMPLPPTVPGGIGGIRPPRIPVSPPLPTFRTYMGDQPLQAGQVSPTVSAGAGMSLAPPTEVTQMAFPIALPGGAAIAGAIGRQMPGILGGLAGGELIEGLVGGGPSLPALPHGGLLFRQTAATVRPRSLVSVMHPVTGDTVYYRYVGKPLLMQGDVRIAKRTDKVLRRASRRRGR